MKKILLIISVQFLCCSLLYAQTGWFPLSSGTGQGLVAIHFTDSNTGYISGWYGTIKKTTNAGINWTVQSVGNNTLTLRSIYFTDANTGFIAAGDPNNIFNGDVYKTTNGGDNWVVLNVPVHTHFYSVQFLNSNMGYVSGYKSILKTTDAGESWISQSYPAGLQWFFTLSFVNENTGYISGGMDNISQEYIVKTTNGGTNWNLVYTDPIGYLFGIQFQDANTGFSAGGSYSSSNVYIIRTTNGGLNWSQVFTNNQATYLWSINMVNANTGYAFGGIDGPFGIILKTLNGGLDWGVQYTYSRLFTGNYFMNENTGYVVGGNGRVLKTTDGGGPFIGIDQISNEVPEDLQLFQNYPNPFNPKTKIKFNVPKMDSRIRGNDNVVLMIYNSLGQEVETLTDGKLQPGTYSVEFDGSMCASGVYFYSLVVDGVLMDTKKMLLLK